MEEDHTTHLMGAALIADYVKRLPDSPGVYRMLDEHGEVHYVGKAKSLKNRVSNYTRPTGHVNRIARMIFLTHSMEFVTTQTERQALLLEANLIKKFKPKYNILLRDDKSFPYILITSDHLSPAITKHRGTRNKKGQYYGPFASSYAVDEAINTIQKAFLIRTCTDSYFENRSRPCLLHQIKRCSAPCTNEISSEAYLELVKQANLFLSGKSKFVRAQLAEEMEAAAEILDFERAAKIRDRLNALANIGHTQNVHLSHTETADIFSIVEDQGHFCVQVFFVRNYQNHGNRSYFPQADSTNTSAEVLGAFISQFYDDKPVPALVLINQPIENHDLLCDALSERAEYKIEIMTPKRGEKRDIVEYAQRNAHDALKRKLAETATQTKLLEELAANFNLPKVPDRIEIYDNSHISGTNAVGAFVVVGKDGFLKNQYRKFNIKNTEISAGDDFAMMKEVLTRRFEHSKIETPQSNDTNTHTQWPLPDLIFIDGGLGQLNAARSILEKFQLNIPIIGIAKGQDRDAGRERFFTHNAPPVTLPPRSAVLFFIQRMRDEAHRFVIGTHRAKRAKSFISNSLDDIPNVGAKRKKALLRHFGTAKGVSTASITDLKMVEGISAALAEQIYAFYRG